MPLTNLPGIGKLSQSQKKLILKNGINSKDHLGNTVLHYACSSGNRNHTLVSELVNMSADVNIKNNAGETPVHKAASVGERSILAILVREDFIPGIRDICGETPMHRLSELYWKMIGGAKVYEEDKLVTFIESSGTIMNLIAILIKDGEDPLAKDDRGNNALALGQSDIYYSYEDNLEEISKLLEGHDAVVRVKNFIGREQERRKVKRKILVKNSGRYSMVIELCSIKIRKKFVIIEHLISILLNDADNLLEKDREYVIKSLLDIDKMAQKNLERYSQIRLCMQNPGSPESNAIIERLWGEDLKEELDMLVYLSQYQKDIRGKDIPSFVMTFSMIDKIGRSNLLRIRSISSGPQSPVTLRALRGSTLLHESCKRYLKGCIKLFTNWGADINAVDDNYLTPLHYVCIVQIKNVIPMLVDKGADILAKDRMMRTLLYYVLKYYGDSNNPSTIKETDEDTEFIIKPRIEMARLLVYHGVDINSTDIYNSTVLDYANKKSHKRIASALIEMGAKTSPISQLLKH